jgi:hypothetical protein
VKAWTAHELHSDDRPSAGGRHDPPYGAPCVDKLLHSHRHLQGAWPQRAVHAAWHSAACACTKDLGASGVLAAGSARQGRAHASRATRPLFHLSAALHCRQSKIVAGVHSTSHNARGAPHRGTSDVGGSLNALPGPLHSSGAGEGRHGPAVQVGCQLSSAERSLPPAAGQQQHSLQEACSARPALFLPLPLPLPLLPWRLPLACAPRFTASCTNCAGADAGAGVGAGTGVAASWLGATSASGAASQRRAAR